MKKSREKHKNMCESLSNYILLFIILLFILLDIYQIIFSLPLQYVIIFSNIEVLLLLYVSYKYLTKGFLISLGIHLLNFIQLHLNYQINDNLIYFQMALYRVVACILSGLICLLAIRQAKYIKKLKMNSFLDDVTDIFNHRYFQERFEVEFSKAKRLNNQLGIIMIDIDNFKKFNDTYGHKIGDVILYESAHVIQEAVRAQDIVCRYGGDEFVIILPQLNEGEIDTIASHIRETYEEYISQNEGAKNLSISISLGYSTFPGIASIKDELISQADTALYHAKQHGRNNVKIYKDIFHDIKQILNTTESQLFISLKTLLGTISAKDRYTLGHSERVMENVVMIGKELKLNEETIKVLKIAALLHDIGKIEIPQQILNKKEKLTNEEFSLIKMHPIYSAEIINPLANLGKLHAIVLHHHERYDGAGYPNGISGKDIPLESRILTVADSFDAMTSDRPYRRSLSLDEAVLELKRCSGTQFDKEIVDIFIKVLEEQKRSY